MLFNSFSNKKQLYNYQFLAAQLLIIPTILLLLIILYDYDNKLILSDLVGRYDAGTYLNLIKGENIIFNSPTPQTIGFLLVAKIEYNLFGDGTVFFLARYIIFTILLVFVAKFKHILSLLHFIPFIFMYSKEAYLIIILLIFYKNQFNTMIFIFIFRPAILPVAVVNFFKHKINHILILVVSLFILMSTYFLEIGYVYQVLNAIEYGNSCSSVISFCYTGDYWHDFQIALTRIISIIPAYLYKSISDIQGVMLLSHPIDIIINLMQATTSIITFILLISLCLRRKLSSFFLRSQLEITILCILIAVTMFVSSERVFDIVKSLIIISYFTYVDEQKVLKKGGLL